MGVLGKGTQEQCWRDTLLGQSGFPRQRGKPRHAAPQQVGACACNSPLERTLDLQSLDGADSWPTGASSRGSLISVLFVMLCGCSDFSQS